MNYIAQINGFWNWRLMNEITHQAVDLYFGILDFANRAGWASPFCIPNSKLVTHCDFADAAQLSKIRNQLVQSGLIEYIPGKKGQAGKYTINYLYNCQIDNNNGSNPDNNTGSNTGSNEGSNTATIPTTYINKNINKNKKEDTPYSPPKGSDVEKPSAEKPSTEKRSAKKTDIDEQLNAVEDETLRKMLGEFVAMRKQGRKPLTAHALELNIKKLYSLSDDTSERIRIVEQAIMSGWQSFYPLKDSNSYYHTPGEFTTTTENIAEVERAFIAAYSK